MTKLALIGADPETFVAQGQRIVHCIGVLGGTKDAPLAVPGGGLQEDNVLFEFNVDPSADADIFASTISKVLAFGSEILYNHGLRVVPRVSSHVYEEFELSGFPEKAFEFGCTPDYNSMTGEVNPRPSAENVLLRTAGGHVHIGYSHLCTVTDETSRAVMNLCDYLLGLPSLIEDTDTRRRELYGKAGACRLKSYGAEYRTLSNYWIWNEAMVKTIHERAQKAFDDHGKLEQYELLIPHADVQACINNGDVAQAKVYLEILRHAAI